MTEKVVILGAGFFGLNVALNLLDSEKEITIIDEDLEHQYIPGVIDLIRDRKSKEELKVDLEEFLEDEEIELVEDRVKNIEKDERKLKTTEKEYQYDKLVVGLGGEPRTFGMDISNTSNVWGIEATQELVERLEDAEKATVIGSGYTGLEVACEIAERGIDTEIIEARTRPAPRLSERSSEKLLEILQAKDIKFRGGQKVEEIKEDEIILEEEESIRSDVTIWCGGVQASKIVQESFDTDAKGLKVNKGLSVKNYKNVFAGGDAAEAECIKTAHNAMSQADVAAENILRDEERLKQFESDKAPLALSLGDTGGIIYKGDLKWIGFPSRLLKDLVRRYYFFRLRWKKLF